MGKFEIKTRKNGEFQFNLKATNGQVILTSEGYNTKAACMNGIESVKKNGPLAERYPWLMAPPSILTASSAAPPVSLPLTLPLPLIRTL